ncbi:MAG: M48 family metallopeptidase [Armatimonadota bacterium]|nr:M48 family metallopeptidase [Armatimonadota bacterium]
MTNLKRMLFVLFIIAIVSLFVCGCKPESLVSKSQEIEIGQEASQQIESRYPVDKDPALNALINQIGQDLAQRCSDRPDLTYTFKILDIKDVNAISLPGGWVYIYKGLIDETQGKPDQLAGVIAHEIGHIAARHHAQMLGREIQAQLLIGTLTKGQTKEIATLFANLQFLRWSRKQEFEADKLGIKYMYRCQKYDPQGLINFFNSLLQKQKDQPSRFEQIFRTHPVTSERIKRAQEYYDALRAGGAE